VLLLRDEGFISAIFARSATDAIGLESKMWGARGFRVSIRRAADSLALARTLGRLGSTQLGSTSRDGANTPGVIHDLHLHHEKHSVKILDGRVPI
jgi:hypothetical protein